jgi:membrane-bound lytic murein transglycosylase F
LSKREYSSKARYGYVNGREPVKYVSEIKERFEAYIDMSGSL